MVVLIEIQIAVKLLFFQISGCDVDCEKLIFYY